MPAPERRRDMPEFEFRWWGGIVHLDRQEGCFAATGVPEASLLFAAIPQPYGLAAAATVQLNKAWIGSRAGTEGVDLHFNWAGFMHWVETRCKPQACEQSRAGAGNGSAASPLYSSPVGAHHRLNHREQQLTPEPLTGT